MKNEKNFDALRMKQKIQEKLNKEYEGMSDSDKNKIIMRKASEDPILSKFIPKGYPAS